ncbi:hypothetical protein FYM84_02950 [Pseudomonas sp. CAH-1]|nr:hypothetical protein [Pseudomonas sp. CAH-1]
MVHRSTHRFSTTFKACGLHVGAGLPAIGPVTVIEGVAPGADPPSTMTTAPGPSTASPRPGP